MLGLGYGLGCHVVVEDGNTILFITPFLFCPVKQCSVTLRASNMYSRSVSRLAKCNINLNSALATSCMMWVFPPAVLGPS